MTQLVDWQYEGTAYRVISIWDVETSTRIGLVTLPAALQGSHVPEAMVECHLVSLRFALAHPVPNEVSYV